MGRKKKSLPSKELLFDTISKMLVPDYILEDFDISGAEEKPSEWLIEMREKEDRIPLSLLGTDFIFDGYCTPIDVRSHSFVCKPIFLRIYRRKYRLSGESRVYFNDYDLTLKGVKMVPELGLFLKTDD
jgi:hypothetical protein